MRAATDNPPSDGQSIGGTAAASQEGHWERRSAGAVKRRRVLIADDEASILSAMRRLLRREPYEIITAGNGAEAMACLEEHPVHLIIADQRMPGLSGTDLLREVRARWPYTIRMILSGYSEVDSIIASINDGAIYKFISKPWNDEELKLHVRRAIEQYELESENRRMADELTQANERLKDLNRVLDQRVADAMMGLNYAQELLESIEVGVITIDGAGLIVGANSHARILAASSQGELVGQPAETALHEVLFSALKLKDLADRPQKSGHLDCGARSLQWRARRISDAWGYRGTVISIWEQIP